MNFTLECEQESDGRWLAEVPQPAGVLVYGSSRSQAMAKADILALRVLAERLEHGEDQPIDIFFSISAAARKARRFLRGGSPRRVRVGRPPVSRVGPVAE